MTGDHSCASDQKCRPRTGSSVMMARSPLDSLLDATSSLARYPEAFPPAQRMDICLEHLESGDLACHHSITSQAYNLERLYHVVDVMLGYAFREESTGTPNFHSWTRFAQIAVPLVAYLLRALLNLLLYSGSEIECLFGSGS